MKLTTQQQARCYAAESSFACASYCMQDGYFADHVTEKTKQCYRLERIKYGTEVMAGLHDHNFTIAQRMHFFTTGECVALLPK